MPRAHEVIALDVAVADPTAIVRTGVVDDDELAAVEPGDRDRPRAIAGRDDRAERHEADVGELRPAVVRVVAQLVEQHCADRGHRMQAMWLV